MKHNAKGTKVSTQSVSNYVSCRLQVSSACVFFIDDWFASNDAYVLSATCDPVSVSVEISKNPESMYAKYLSSIDIYIIDYNCTGDDSIMVSSGLVYCSLHLSTGITVNKIVVDSWLFHLLFIIRFSFHMEWTIYYLLILKQKWSP